MPPLDVAVAAAEGAQSRGFAGFDGGLLGDSRCAGLIGTFGRDAIRRDLADGGGSSLGFTDADASGVDPIEPRGLVMGVSLGVDPIEP